MKSRAVWLTGFIVLCIALSLIPTGCTGPATPTQPAGSTTPTVAATTWRLQSYYAEGDKIVALLRDVFAPTVYEQSKGRLKIDVSPVGSIVAFEDLFQAVSQGALPIVEMAGGFAVGELPITVLEEPLPFEIRGTLQDFKALFSSGLEDMLRSAYASKNVYLVGYQSEAGYPAICSRVPVRKFDDWKGLKVSAYGSYNTLYNKMGAAASYIPVADRYTALKLGTVDVVNHISSAVIDMKFYEAMDYLIMPPWTDHILSNILVNMDAWKALPDDLKAAIKVASEKQNEAEFAWYSQEWKKVLERAKELGYEVIYLPDADVQKITNLAVEIWDQEAAKNPDTAKAVQLIKNYYKK